MKRRMQIEQQLEDRQHYEKKKAVTALCFAYSLPIFQLLPLTSCISFARYSSSPHHIVSCSSNSPLSAMAEQAAQRARYIHSHSEPAGSASASASALAAAL